VHSVRRLLQGGVSFDVVLILLLVYAVAGGFPAFVEWVPSLFGVVAVYLAVYLVIQPSVVLPLLLTPGIAFLACVRSPRLVPVSRVILSIVLAFALSAMVMVSHTGFVVGAIVLGLIFFGRAPKQVLSSSRRARFVIAFPLLALPIFIFAESDTEGSLLTVEDNAGVPPQFFSVAVDSKGNVYSSLKHAGRVIGIAADAGQDQAHRTNTDAAVKPTSIRDTAEAVDLTNQITAPERFAITADNTVYVANRGPGFGVFSFSRDSASPPKQVLSTGAIDLIADDRNHRILALGELNGELAIYDTEQHTETYLRLPDGDTTVFSISNGPESGEYFLSMGFHGMYLLRLRIDYETYAYDIDRLPVGFFSFGLFYHQPSGLLYVSRPLLGLVDVIDVRRFERIQRLRTPMLVREIAVSGDGKLLFAANYFTGTLWVVRTDSGERCAAYATAEHPRMIEYSSFHNAVFVALEDRLMGLSLDTLPPSCLSGSEETSPAAWAGASGHEPLAKQ